MKIECRKCGSDAVKTEYNYVHDHLSRVCGTCGYRWNDLPLDRPPAQPEEKRP